MKPAPWRPNIVKNQRHCAHLAGKGDLAGIFATKHQLPLLHLRLI